MFLGELGWGGGGGGGRAGGGGGGGGVGGPPPDAPPRRGTKPEITCPAMQGNKNSKNSIVSRDELLV